jgi:hypothetical protein
MNSNETREAKIRKLLNFAKGESSKPAYNE